MEDTLGDERGLTASLSRRSLLGRAVEGALLVSGVKAAPAAEGRTRESFDFGWRFHKGDAPGAQNPDFADSGWRGVDLPHDWSIEGPFSEKERAQGSLPTGIGWYRKRFRTSGRGRAVWVEFDGVYENSEVWINGHYLGKRPNGYINFCYDLTPHLRFEGENTLAVRVDNSHQRNSRWYSGSGIYRHVWLVTAGKLRVDYLGTFVTTPRVSEKAAVVQIRTRVRNDSTTPALCTLASTVNDREGKPAGNVESSQEIAAGGAYGFVQQMQLEKPSLWSVESPYLYAVRSSVRRDSREVDSYETPFGIREIAFDADRGFLLNGRRVKLNGVCLHHDAGAVGAAVPERVWERRLEILKKMGCNAIRTAHNPPAAEFLDLCDRMGFLVMDEIFDEWKIPKGQIDGFGYSMYFDEWHERDVTAFVRRDRNHPSVVLWSAGNEVGDQASAGGAETLRKLNAIFHREDPTRLVTVGCDRIESEPAGTNRIRPEFYDAMDVVGYNYVDRWRDRKEKFFSIDRERFPGKKFIGTESGSMGGARGEYSALVPRAGGGGFFFFRGGRPSIDVEQLQKFVQTYDYVAGDHMWTGIDYLGESRWPFKGAAAGVIDTCGFVKDGYYFYQSQWTKEPVLHIFPHWNWAGQEGVFIPVYCYTNCDTVELFLNGKSVGVQGYAFPRPGMVERWGVMPPRAKALRTTADLHLMWTVPYEPGTLKAVGTRDGKVVATVEVATAGEPAAVELSADRQTIQADRRDVVHVTVRIVDAQGRMAPAASNEVAFEVQGEGRLIGLDNGDMGSHEDYQGKTRKAYNGMCLAIVQATAKAGQISVRATSAGLKGAEVAVVSR
ncbi:MAG: DUF4982 domain-containing protein [Bryobacterales bacterium]|nr:DUF4982 domain-containing protein [Bryobacterales bacterium]